MKEKVGFCISQRRRMIRSKAFCIVESSLFLFLEILSPILVFITIFTKPLRENRSTALTTSTPVTISLRLGIAGNASMASITMGYHTTSATILACSAKIISLVWAKNALLVQCGKMGFNFCCSLLNGLFGSPNLNRVFHQEDVKTSCCFGDSLEMLSLLANDKTLF